MAPRGCSLLAMRPNGDRKVGKKVSRPAHSASKARDAVTRDGEPQEQGLGLEIDSQPHPNGMGQQRLTHCFAIQLNGGKST